jgi:hypothetical protein
MTALARSFNAAVKTAVNIKPKASNGAIPRVDVDKLRDVLHTCSMLYSSTPDAVSMELTSLYQPVFIYCEVSAGGKQHNVIQNIIKLKDDDGKSANPQAFTKDRFEVWQTNNGSDSRPVALINKKTDRTPHIALTQPLPRPSHLKGRVYLVRSDCMNILDNYKMNGVVFRRRAVSVILPYRELLEDSNGVRRQTVELGLELPNVWMYIGKRKYWDEWLDMGYTTRPCELHTYPEKNTRWIGGEPFYEFKAREIAKLPSAPEGKNASQLAEEYEPPKKRTTLQLIEDMNFEPLDKLLNPNHRLRRPK